MSGATETLGRGTVYLEVAGNIESRLDSVMEKLDRLIDIAGDGASSAASTMENTWETALTNVSNTLDEVGHRWMAWGDSIRESLRGVVDTFMEAGTEFQSLQSRFNFEFGESSDTAWGTALDIAADTLMSTNDVVSQAVSLHRAGVDALSPMVMSRTGEMIPAMEALSDLAATKGERGSFLLERTMQQFFSGSTEAAVSHIKTLFDLPVNQLNEYIAAIDAAEQTSQGRFEAFAQVTGRLFGGAGRAMGDTWQFQIAQLEDQWEIFRYEVTDTFLTALNPIIAWATEFLQDLRAMEEETHAFSRAFETLAAVLNGILHVVAPIVDLTMALIHEYPDLVTYAVEFALAMSAVLTAAGGILVAVAGLLPALGAFVWLSAQSVALAEAWAAFSAGVAAFAAGASAWLAPVLAVIAAITAAVYLAYEAFENDFGGVASILRRVWLGITAVYEIFTSMSEDGMARLSEETYDALGEEDGLLGLVVSIGGAMFRLGSIMDGVWSGITAAFQAFWTSAGPILERVFDEAGGLLGGALWRQLTEGEMTLAGITNAINSMTPEQWEEIGKQIGIWVGNLLTGGAQMLEIIAAVHSFIGFMDSLIERWERIEQIVRAVTQLVTTIAAPMSPMLGMANALFGGGGEGGATGGVEETASTSSYGPKGRPMPLEMMGSARMAGAPTQARPMATTSGAGIAPTRATLTMDSRRVGEALIPALTREGERVGLGVGTY